MPRFQGASAGAFGASRSAFGASSASPISFVSEPLDLSGISNPSTTVILKNLSKSAENTKVKALEELANIITASQDDDIEESLLTTWVKLYPRLSVDISKRVRQLAHEVHASICATSKKRMARYMPEIIGPWIAGTYDNDRTVASAARQSFSETFGVEKLKKVWVNTLSDERQVSTEDAEAKFSRVISACISVLRHLLMETSSTYKAEKAYSDLFADEDFWKFSANPDPYVRKAVYQLIKTALEKHKSYIEDNLPVISSEILVRASRKSQLGSLPEYVDMLISLTKACPKVWKVKSKKVKKPISIFAKLVALGSQGGPPDVWSSMQKLFDALPTDVLPTVLQDVQELLKAYAEGVNNPQEPRTHAVLSWAAYFGACRRLLCIEDLPDFVRHWIIDQVILPVYEKYLFETGTSSFKFRGPLATTICLNGLLKLSPERNQAFSDPFVSKVQFETFKEIFEIIWTSLQNAVHSQIQSYENKTLVSEMIFRWVDLVVELYQALPEEGFIRGILMDSSRTLILNIVEKLNKSKGEDDQLAEVLKQLLDKLPRYIWEESDILSALEDFFSVNLPSFGKPFCLPTLFAAMTRWFTYASDQSVEALWQQNIEALLSRSEDEKVKLLTDVLQQTSPSIMTRFPMVPSLQQYLFKKIGPALKDNDDAAWKLLLTAASREGVVVDQTLTTEITRILVNQVHMPVQENWAPEPLHNVELDKLISLTKASTKTVARYLFTEGIIILDFALLAFIKRRMEQWRGLGEIIQKYVADCEDEALQESLAEREAICVKSGLRVGPYAELEYGVLSGLTGYALQTGAANSSRQLSLMFTNQEWTEVVDALSRITVSRNIALTNQLRGCANYIDKPVQDTDDEEKQNTIWSALRMTLYTLSVWAEWYPSLPDSDRVQTFLQVCFVNELIQDTMNSTEAESPINYLHIWKDQLNDSVKDIIWDVNEEQTVFGESDSFLNRYTTKLVEQSKGTSWYSFYTGRVLCNFLRGWVETKYDRDQHKAEISAFIDGLGVRQSNDIFLSCAVLRGFEGCLNNIPVAEKLRNALGNDVTGISTSAALAKCPPHLVLFNALMPDDLEEPLNIPQQRGMFLVRHVLSWFDVDEDGDTNVDAQNEDTIGETAYLLNRMVVDLKDIYGQHWNTMYRFICLGLKANRCASKYWCLKLQNKLQEYIDDNDDIQEAYASHKAQIQEALIADFEHISANNNIGPERLYYEALQRYITDLPVTAFQTVDRIYSKLMSPSEFIRDAAYEVLDEYISRSQEQLAVEAALTGDDEDLGIHLPPELLSLVVDLPEEFMMSQLGEDNDPEAIAEMAHRYSSEPVVVGFFAAWALILHHFEKATFKIKSAYINDIQTGGYFDELMMYLIEGEHESLGTSYTGAVAEPLHPTKIDLTDRSAMNFMYGQLFYRALLYTPSLVKSWDLSQTRNSIIKRLEEATEKSFSGLIADAEFSRIARWLETDRDDTDLEVKLSKAVREVRVAYSIDDQKLEMVIRLPPLYPLKNVDIEGARKVGFTEQQWKAMQLACRGVIAHRGGSVLDGLLLFKKNVALHFSGVQECAICYSIVGPDRTLPQKSCATCKNRFHSDCLYKWFSSSNSSTCPLCRTAWQFYGGLAK